MILSFRPIKVMPESFKPAGASRPSSPFSATYDSTLRVLDRELGHLRATHPILQVAAQERDCRLDGQLRANARVDHPGVILSFDTRKFGTLSYPCDAFHGWSGRPGWQANLRAIALGLEALRRVERYGIAERGQQYAGYRELGSGIPMGAAQMTVEQAAVVLRDAAGWQGDWDPFVDRVQIEVAWKMAVKAHHPDRGGDPERFRLAAEAKDLLDQHLT